MKKSIKFISILCAFVMLLTAFTACQPSSNGSEEETTDTFVIEDTEEARAEIIEGIYLFQYGTSPYVLVCPETDYSCESLAAEEFSMFFKEATGYALEIVTDVSLVSEKDKFISFGNTKQFQESGIETDTDFGRSGYGVSTINNNIYIYGGNTQYDKGVLYGAYDILEELVGYRSYAVDEYKIENKTYVELRNFNYEYLPSIDVRSLNFGSLASDTTYKNRMRLIDRFNSSDWAINGHSMLKILDPNIYLEEHPEWFAELGTAGHGSICYTNAEAEAEFVERCKQFILENDQSIYISVTQMDDFSYCKCENCLAKIALYTGENQKGNGVGGLYLDFLNRIGAKIEEWLEAEYPEREMTIVGYAYYNSFVPPAQKNENGEWIPNHEDCVPRDNVTIMFCPIGQNYFYSIDDTKNIDQAEAYAGWAAISNGRMFIYEYGANFSEYLVNFPNFFGMADRFKYYADQGATYYFEQTSWGTSTPCFEALRIYLESSLLWDHTLSYEELVDDFFVNYYKNASGPMLEYYEKQRSHWAYLSTNYESAGICNQAINRAEHWPLATLNGFMDCFDEAFAAIEPLKETDPDMYNTLWNRIKKEQLSTLYLLCKLYKGNYVNEFDSMISDLETYGPLYGIIYSFEGGNYQNTIAGLKE